MSLRGLSGKVAIVTGGSRGIGRAIVDRLLYEGVYVLFCGRNPDTGAKTLKEFEDKYGKGTCAFISVDMGKWESPPKLFAECKKVFGEEPDFLANNAFPFTAKWVDATEEDFEHAMMAGPVSYAHMIAEFSKRKTKKKGAITCTSSISGHVAQLHRWTYNMGKGAVKQLIRCAALDLAPDIRVNCYSPSWVKTDEVFKALPEPKSWDNTPQAWKEYHMNSRLQEPWEMAAVVAFLFSDDASAITGADIDATSGYLAMGPEGNGKTANFACSD
jgi:NAD(P)-dependent dehydrogenase (short-subunit alcohol dehydrogenase family)